MKEVKSNFLNCHHGGIHSAKNHNLVKIDFSSNINPLGISKKVIKSLIKNINLSYIYPDPNCIELKKDILKYLDCNIEDIDHIIMGNGATELIHYFSSTFVKKKVIIPSPTFCEYELASKRSNAKITYSQVRKDYQIDSEFIVRNSNNPNNGITTIFLCNPNNPTGKDSKKQVIEIFEKINDKIAILLDESYVEFISDKDEKRYNYFINLIKDYNNIVVLRSLTKTCGLAGLRIGYAVSNKKTIEKMKNKLIAWNVNGLAQIAAREALKDKNYLNSAKKIIEIERRRSFDMLKKNDKIKPICTDVNFYLIEILNNKNSTEITDTLLYKNNLLVRDCKTFVGMNDKFIRVAIKTSQENNELFKALERAL
ncbi:MAG: histidinol-phosphate aminotransferase family protein [Thermoproteota archaeon]|nr:histidinol-phosphate aminotransferase family protein [Thermoproteota archaeon]